MTSLLAGKSFCSILITGDVYLNHEENDSDLDTEVLLHGFSHSPNGYETRVEGWVSDEAAINPNRPVSTRKSKQNITSGGFIDDDLDAELDEISEIELTDRSNRNRVHKKNGSKSDDVNAELDEMSEIELTNRSNRNRKPKQHVKKEEVLAKHKIEEESGEDEEDISSSILEDMKDESESDDTCNRQRVGKNNKEVKKRQQQEQIHLQKTKGKKTSKSATILSSRSSISSSSSSIYIKALDAKTESKLKTGMHDKSKSNSKRGKTELRVDRKGESSHDDQIGAVSVQTPVRTKQSSKLDRKEKHHNKNHLHSHKQDANKDSSKSARGQLNFINDSGTQINFWGVSPEDLIEGVKKRVEKEVAGPPNEPIQPISGHDEEQWKPPSGDGFWPSSEEEDEDDNWHGQPKQVRQTHLLSNSI